MAYPFWAAAASAAATPRVTSPGSHTTPASEAASAARWTLRLLAQYQETSTTTARMPTKTIVATAKMARTWPRWRRLAGGVVAGVGEAALAVSGNAVSSKGDG